LLLLHNLRGVCLGVVHKNGRIITKTSFFDFYVSLDCLFFFLVHDVLACARTPTSPLDSTQPRGVPFFFRPPTRSPSGHFHFRTRSSKRKRFCDPRLNVLGTSPFVKRPNETPLSNTRSPIFVFLFLSKRSMSL